jgi:hypothetical protein
MIPDFETWRTASPEARRLCFSQSPNLQVSPSGTAVLNTGLTHLAGSVLQSRPFHPTHPMNSFSRPNRPILPSRDRFLAWNGAFPPENSRPISSGVLHERLGVATPPSGVAHERRGVLHGPLMDAGPPAGVLHHRLGVAHPPFGAAPHFPEGTPRRIHGRPRRKHGAPRLRQ